MVLLKGDNIHDFSSTLPFHTPITQYFEQSFIEERLLHATQIPMFRVLSAEDYIRWFLSDRRHMKTNNGWNAQPPGWPLISDTSSNLNRFTNMTDKEFGVVWCAAEVLKNHA